MTFSSRQKQNKLAKSLYLQLLKFPSILYSMHQAYFPKLFSAMLAKKLHRTLLNYMFMMLFFFWNKHFHLTCAVVAEEFSFLSVCFVYFGGLLCFVCMFCSITIPAKLKRISACRYQSSLLRQIRMKVTYWLFSRHHDGQGWAGCYIVSSGSISQVRTGRGDTDMNSVKKGPK